MPDEMTTRAYRVPYNRDYETCERTVAYLLIYTGAMDPARVTEVLGISPTSFTEAGRETFIESTGRTRVDKVNGWHLSSESIVKSKDLRHHLDWLLAQLSGKHLALTKLQNSEGVTMTVNCVWWSAYGDGGPTLWPSQMRDLAILNLECCFEFAYYGDGEETLTVPSPSGRSY